MKKIYLLFGIILILFQCKTSNDISERHYNRRYNNEFEFHSEHISIYLTCPPYDPIIDDKLIELIDTAKDIDICFYGLNRENVIKAIENAISNNVHVRFIGDKSSDEYYEGYRRIALALDEKLLGNRAENLEKDYYDDFKLINSGSIMHNKFVLITTNNDKKYLYTGSTNCTDSCFERNNNNSLIIQDSGIAQTYKEQFEYLIGIRNIPVNEIKIHIIDDIKFEVLFSPVKFNNNKSTIDYLVDITDNADKSIHFLIFSFPYMPLNMLMLNKFNNGVDVKGVVDKSQLNNCSEEYLAQHGLPVKIDGNEHIFDNHGGKLHHKVMILDSKQDDAVVVTGSFNWSKNANENNNENMILIHSKKIAEFYESEFNRRWEESNQVNIVTVPGDQGNYQDIIINEVMWMGARSNDGKIEDEQEFIELKNLTNRKIFLGGWSIMGSADSQKPIVFKSGTYIDPNSILIIMNGYPETLNYAYNPIKYIVCKDLGVTNKNILLILEDIDRTPIDYAGNGTDGKDFSGFNGSGDTGKKQSMSRKQNFSDGRDINNWFTTPISNQKNIDANFNKYTFGTPGFENE